MLSFHLICLLLLFCFAQSKPDDETKEETTKGLLWKIIKETGNRKCLCGNVRLPDYTKDNKDDRFFEKYGDKIQDINYERSKLKNLLKKCTCSIDFNDNYHINDKSEFGLIRKQDISYQIDKYEDRTDKPLREKNTDYLLHKGSHFERHRYKRNDKMDDNKQNIMKLTDETKEIETFVQETDQISNHNRNKSAQALEKVGYGLGLASEIVQNVSDRVGSMMGGSVAKTVLDQVSFGLGLASNAAQTAAEDKRNGKKRRSVEEDSVHKEGMKMNPRLSGEGFNQVRNGSKQMEEIINVLVKTIGQSFRHCIIDVVINGNYDSRHYSKNNDLIIKNTTAIRERFKQIGILLSGTLNTSAGLIESYGPLFIGPMVSRIISCGLQKTGGAINKINGQN